MPEKLHALHEAFQQAVDYRAHIQDRDCAPQKTYHEMREIFAEPLPETGMDDAEIIRSLVRDGDQGLMQMAHPRFFGWVLGASHPAGVAADWLASAWGQNTGAHTPSPTTAAIEETAAGWILEILDLPRRSSVGFVTGASVGNLVGLAAARGKTLREHGWDPDADGLIGAPELHVFIGDDAHTSVFSALQHLGLGPRRAIRIDADRQGRMDPRHLRREVDARSGPKIIIGQAGQINTGAFDPFDDLVEIARDSGAWLHVDAAFGLWARANPDLKPMTTGLDGADSWATDGHKWLQTPFDTGYAIVRHPEDHLRAMTTMASYLPVTVETDRMPSQLVPELSRRARGLPTWAILKALGRQGVSEMVGRHCAVARHIAERLSAGPDLRIMNEVVLNQVTVSFGSAESDAETRQSLTEAVIDAAVATGQLFVGGGRWQGEWVMRLSVISHNVSIADADITADAILAAWETIRAA
ncbi:MAG: aminotransferase class V-fold PLP-dependent enzyme [Alphaproteobacteria bacterium]|nr:aminotransferase class V-fold PLP-dependent enzyme [Alphaproteobacteria bacterium]